LPTTKGRRETGKGPFGHPDEATRAAGRFKPKKRKNAGTQGCVTKENGDKAYKVVVGKKRVLGGQNPRITTDLE